MTEKKTFGRWEITGSLPFIETKLADGELYSRDAKVLLKNPEYRRSVFESLAEKEGISPQDISDFQEALISLGVENSEVHMVEDIDLTDDDRKVAEAMGVNPEDLLEEKKAQLGQEVE